MTPRPTSLDCIIVGAGPAGLTAALYLARYRRRVLVFDADDSRAAKIPLSHNIPTYEAGISGPDLLRKMRDHLADYGRLIVPGTVSDLARDANGFHVRVETRDGAVVSAAAPCVLLATGTRDIEPDLPDLPEALEAGLIRYCPVCDGYEVADKRLAILGRGAHGVREALFVKRTFSRDTTLITLGSPLSRDDEERCARDGLVCLQTPVERYRTEDGCVVLQIGGVAHRFDRVYCALGLEHRSALAVALGADHDECGALTVDDHKQTSVRGLYAAGGAARGLDQVVIAMGEAAVAATSIHRHDVCRDF